MSLSHLEFLRVTATLQTLETQQRSAGRFKFNVFKPALNQCSQLLKVKFYENAHLFYRDVGRVFIIGNFGLIHLVKSSPQGANSAFVLRVFHWQLKWLSQVDFSWI